VNGQGNWVNSSCNHTACTDGWYGTNGECCTSENSDSCCTTSNTGTGHSSAGTWTAALSTCCHGNDTSSNACCKANHNDNWWLSDQISGGYYSCCGAEDANPPYCCEASNNPNGAGKLVSRVDNASIPYCCHDETYSDSCCKKFKGDSYSLSGGVCKEPETPEWNLAVQYGTCYWVGTTAVNPYPTTNITDHISSTKISASAYGPTVFDYWEKVSGTCSISDTSSTPTTVSISGSNTCTVKAHCKEPQKACAYIAAKTSGYPPSIKVEIGGTEYQSSQMFVQNSSSCGGANIIYIGNYFSSGRTSNDIKVKGLGIHYLNTSNPSGETWTIKNFQGMPVATYGTQLEPSAMGGAGESDFTITVKGGTHDYCTTAKQCYNGEYGFSRFEVCAGSGDCSTFILSLWTTQSNLSNFTPSSGSSGSACKCTPYYCSKACCEAEGGQWKGGSGKNASSCALR